MILKPDIDYGLALVVLKKSEAGIGEDNIVGHVNMATMRDYAELFQSDKNDARRLAFAPIGACIGKWLRDHAAEKAALQPKEPTE